ncbi:hypothetical protein C8F01DRAFT_1142061, partial [Mycena amicta]
TNMTRLSNDNAPLLDALRQRPHHLGRVPGHRVPPPNHHSADSVLEIPISRSQSPRHPCRRPLSPTISHSGGSNCPVHLETRERAAAQLRIAGSSLLGKPNLIDEYTAISSRSTSWPRALLGDGGQRTEDDAGRLSRLDDDCVRHGEVLLPDYVGTELQMISRSSRTLDSLTRVAFNIKTPNHRPGCDAAHGPRHVQWISEGPDCREFSFLASSSNFTVHLWPCARPDLIDARSLAS